MDPMNQLEVNPVYKRKPVHKLLTGKKYGRLTVLDFVGLTRRKQPIYKVVCDCGKVIDEFRAWKMTNGDAQSCGCLLLEILRAPRPRRRGWSITTKSWAFTLFKYAVKRQVKRGHPCDDWDIDKWYSIASMPCHYCGSIDIRNVLNSPTKRIRRSFTMSDEDKLQYRLPVNGLDRVNSSIGYVFDNCVSCCGQCNIAKSDYTKEEFLAMARRIVSKWGAHA